MRQPHCQIITYLASVVSGGGGAIDLEWGGATEVSNQMGVSDYWRAATNLDRANVIFRRAPGDLEGYNA